MVDNSEVNKPVMILPRLVYLHPGGSRAHFSLRRINDGRLDTCGEAIIARSPARPSPLLPKPRAPVTTTPEAARVRRSSLWLCSAI